MKQPVKVELFYDAAWQNVTADVYVRDGIKLSHGRGDEQAQAPPSECKLTFKSPTGTYNPRNPTSTLFGKIGRNTPIRVTVDTDIRLAGEVAVWEPRRSIDDGDAWVNITADGVSRRLGQGSAPLHSAMRRYIEAASPVGYWPLDGGQLSNAGRAVVGEQPASLIPESARPRRPGFGMEVATVVTRESTSSTSYTDLATAGPAVTVVIGISGRALVFIGAQCELATGSIQNALASYAVTGASSVAASNERAVGLRDVPSSMITASHATLIEGLNPGENTFTMKYRKTTVNDDPFFAERTIVVIPF